jgi:phosphoglycerate transport regulatory protein PgtC
MQFSFARTAVASALIALFAPLAAQADTISVVTSFPKELTAAYKKAYEAKYPNDKVEILNKNTSAGIAYVREQAAGSRPEVFWASAPDAFEVLAGQKLLVNIGPGNPDIPAKVGNYPVNDPQRAFTAVKLWRATA